MSCNDLSHIRLGPQLWSEEDETTRQEYIERILEKFKKENNMNGIGWAIKEMQNGAKVARAGWNSKGMFLFLVPGSTFQVNRAPLLGIYPEGTEINYQSHIDLKTADGQIVPWNASQSDLLATDWELAI